MVKLKLQSSLSNYTSATEMETGDANSTTATGFSVLSEGCISDILSLTSPRDACRASSISWGFKALADSDAVWERFLPSDYQEIISRAAFPVLYSTKKELYFRLCDPPILLDGGRLSFNINKQNGKKCYLLGAKDLSIAWKDTFVYWRWKSLPESRFPEVAELLVVCWLEIKGKIGTQILSPETSYGVYLVFSFAATCHGLDSPAKTLVRLVRKREGTFAEDTNTVCLRIPPTSGWQNSGSRDVEPIRHHPQKRSDGWMEIEIGKFFYGKEDDGEVEMRFMEIERLNWKSGLIVEGIEIRPKDEA